jgi:hypothetical protein
MFARTLTAALALMALPSLAQAGTYLPWQAGDEAVFEDAGTGLEETIEIAGTYRGSWLRYSNFFGLQTRWVKSSPHNEVIKYWDGNRVRVFMDMDAPVGTTVPVDFAPCNEGDATLAARGLQIQTPAGSFDEVIRIDLETSCIDAGIEQIFFAKGVGPIQWSTTTLIGALAFQLSEGNIAGQSYPQAWGVAVTGRFETDSPWINKMPFAGPPPPPTTYRAGIRLANDTSYPLTYQFNSTQQFDILIFDESGALVSSWSRNLGFGDVVFQVTVEPGDALEFTGEVELTTDTGEDLPPGNYTVRAELTSWPTAGTSHAENADPPAAEHPIRLLWAL